MNKLEELYRESGEIAPYARGYLDYLKDVLDKLDETSVAAFVDVLLKARDLAHSDRVYLLGVHAGGRSQFERGCVPIPAVGQRQGPYLPGGGARDVGLQRIDQARIRGLHA